NFVRGTEVREGPAGVIHAARCNKRIQELLVVAAVFEVANEPAVSGSARSLRSKEVSRDIHGMTDVEQRDRDVVAFAPLQPWRSNNQEEKDARLHFKQGARDRPP